SFSFFFGISPPVSLHHSLIHLPLRLSLSLFPPPPPSLILPLTCTQSLLCPRILLSSLPVRPHPTFRFLSFSLSDVPLLRGTRLCLLRLRDFALVVCGQSAKRSCSHGCDVARRPLSSPVAAPEAPVIDTQRTYAYDQIFLCWRLPQHSPAAWHYTVEFRRAEPKGKALKLWQRREEVRGTSAIVEYVDTDSVYVLRVRGYNKAGFGDYSEDIYLRTPPAPVLNFFLDNRWGFNRERLAISKDQRAVRSVPGLPMLFAAERLMTSCHLSIDLVIGDVAVTQGRSYWACCVDPSSYLVKVGVGLESKLQEWFQVPQDVTSPRYDPDSGHDSGAEDTTLESSPPFAFLTIGMGKILLSHGVSLTSRDAGNATVPLPPRVGICLDYEHSKVTFFDAVSFRSLWECGVDCSGPVCPAFCFIGGGALHLQELVVGRQERKVTISGFSKLD
ncbi:tripartite motif-containing protein 46-like, partial [Notechis scutatus]|uniref:Tripartite motif-containing protein 46-like n=1 Tax=Notechis scutatus TaxID=8663 RepID=A0A6J1VZ86_9SAUR